MISNTPPVDAHTKYQGYGNEAFDVVNRIVGQLNTEGDINMELWVKLLLDKTNQFNIGTPPVEEPSIVPAIYFDDPEIIFIDADNNRTTYILGGDVTGPASSTDNAIARFDSTTGKVIQNSTVTIDDDGNETGVNSLGFDTTPTTVTLPVGGMQRNDSDGTLDLKLKGGNVTLQIGQEEVIRVVNKVGSDLLEANYQAVKITGAQGQRPKVELALGDNDLNSATTIGLVTETIANNQEGFITTNGIVRGINTTGSLQSETWADGDIVYLSPTVSGGITNIKPTAPNHTVVIGWVIHAHATQGKIFVKVDNGYEYEELHNVSTTAHTAIKDTDLVSIKEDSTSLWKPSTWSNIKSVLKTYFDTLYSTITGSQNSVDKRGTTAGTANTYTLTLTPAITAYVAGQTFNVKFHVANTGASTININGLGAKTLVKDVSTALVSGDIPINSIYQILYDGTNFLIKDIGFAGINTSARLAGALSDETGSGSAVFATSPTFTTSIIGSATMAVMNTVSTVINAFGAATTLTIGGTPTTAVTHTYSGNATATATTKTVNLGTGGAAGSTTNVNIGSANGGTTSITSPIVSLGGITGASTTGTIELGHATDTTISRLSAGVIAVEGVAVPTISSTSTLTNKSISLGSNTMTMTKAELNTAVTDNDVAFINGGNTFSGNQSITGDLTVNGQNRNSGWTSYTPTVTADTGSVGSSTVSIARYKQIGKSVFVTGRMVFTKGTLSGSIYLSLPVADSGGYLGCINAWIGDQGATGAVLNGGRTQLESDGKIRFENGFATTNIQASDLGAGNVRIRWNGVYEVA